MKLRIIYSLNEYERLISEFFNMNIHVDYDGDLSYIDLDKQKSISDNDVREKINKHMNIEVIDIRTYHNVDSIYVDILYDET